MKRPGITETQIGGTDIGIEAEAEAETEILTGEDIATATPGRIGAAIGHQERDTRHGFLAQGITEMTGAATRGNEVIAAKKSYICLENHTEGTEIGAAV